MDAKRIAGRRSEFRRRRAMLACAATFLCSAALAFTPQAHLAVALLPPAPHTAAHIISRAPPPEARLRKSAAVAAAASAAVVAKKLLSRPRQRRDEGAAPDAADAPAAAVPARRGALALLDGEADALSQMRTSLAAELQAAPQFPELVGDDRLLRFLRKGGSAEAATKRYCAMLALRAERGGDEARRDILARGLGFDDLPHYEAVQKFLPHEFLAISSPGSVNADGKPVDSLVQQRQANGAWDTVGITRAVDRGEELTQEDFLE